MSELGPKFCPVLSTIKVIPQELVFQGQTQGEAVEEPSLNLQGLAAGMNAKTKGSTKSQGVLMGKAGFGYKTRISEDMAKQINSGELKIEDVPPEALKPIADSFTAPCAKSACHMFCEEHQACDYGGGCKECQAQTMTKAFSAALAAQTTNSIQEKP